MKEATLFSIISIRGKCDKPIGFNQKNSNNSIRHHTPFISTARGQSQRIDFWKLVEREESIVPESFVDFDIGRIESSLFRQESFDYSTKSSWICRFEKKQKLKVISFFVGSLELIE